MSFPTSEKPRPYGRVVYEREQGNPDVTRRNHHSSKIRVIDAIHS
jgi:hypothetical protein